VDLNPDKITPPPGNPGGGMSGQVFVHPSHICQIGESDQGLIEWIASTAQTCMKSNKKPISD
jgi:hypothetical protein